MSTTTPQPNTGALARALKRMATLQMLELVGPIRYGWRHKSAGSEVRKSSGERAWLRVTCSDQSNLSEKLWRGNLEASKLEGIRKPTVTAFHEWDDRLIRWRAELMTFIDEPACSVTADLQGRVRVSDGWFLRLRQSLDALSSSSTDRVAVRQDLVTRRMVGRFGKGVDTVIEKWKVVHGDIHWANVTTPGCWILDWESWGVGPAPLDAALLYCFSLREIENAADVYRHFEDVLLTSDGKKTLLFVCAELLRMIDIYGDHPALGQPLTRLADSILAGRDHH